MDRIRELEIYAKDNNIPIMEKEGILFLLSFIKDNNIKHILEIGSAIGYSAIMMSSVNDNIKIDTIERDYNRYLVAVDNIKRFDKEKQINIINIDALEFDTDKKYDLIFIDAAKSQYITFFNKFIDNLKPNGYIISDNLHFHGLVFNDKSNLSKNVKGIVSKLEKYITFLNENKEYITEFIDIGDGISITRRSIYENNNNA
jgi:predicted O-methyltransferase YrrM